MAAKDIIMNNKEQILDWYLEDHVSQREIASRLGVSKTSVGYYLHDVWQIKPPQKNRATTDLVLNNKDNIIDMYVNKKMNTRDIGLTIGVSKTTITTYLRKWNVEIRPDSFSIQPLAQEIYGYLKPLYPLHDEHGKVKWHCKCLLCGGEKDVLTNQLTSGATIHCGCATQSKGVLRIKKVLQEANIPFLTEYWFDDLRHESGLPVMFDFYVDHKYIIEYDGEQHFRNTKGFHTQEGFEERQKRDQMRNKYCLEHNIPLIRIPYTYTEKINLELLTPSSNNPFLVDRIDFRKETI